jgi:TolA-binding protein
MKGLAQARNKIAHEAESLAKTFEQGEKEAKRGATDGGGAPAPRRRKIILKWLVGINLILLVSVVIAFSKPVWVGHVKGWFSPSPQRSALYQRSPVRPSLTPDFNRTITQRPPIAGRTTPPMQAPTARSPQVARLQPTIPSKGEIPKTSVPSSLPSTGQDQGLDEYLEVGALYAQKGRYQKAEELFKKVTQGNPSSAQAHNNLGFVYLKQGKYEAAEREFKESLRIDPASVLSNYNLACLYSRKGQTAEALIYLNRALKKDARVKAWAMSDDDFDKIRSDVVFQELVGAPAPKAGSPKQKAVQKQEGAQKPFVPQKSMELQKPVVPQKPVEPQKQEGTQGGAPKQVEPPKPVEPPKQVEPQKQEGAQGGAYNKEGVQGAAPDQKELQGGAQQGVQGGNTK